MFSCLRAHDMNSAWTNSDICVQSYVRVCVFAVLRVCGFAGLRVCACYIFVLLCLDLGWVVMNISTDFIVSKA